MRFQAYRKASHIEITDLLQPKNLSSNLSTRTTKRLHTQRTNLKALPQIAMLRLLNFLVLLRTTPSGD